MTAERKKRCRSLDAKGCRCLRRVHDKTSLHDYSYTEWWGDVEYPATGLELLAVDPFPSMEASWGK